LVLGRHDLDGDDDALAGRCSIVEGGIAAPYGMSAWTMGIVDAHA
jgi:hypothetical protein